MGQSEPQRLNARQERILAITESQGFVTIEKLAEGFGVSGQTIRRDIIALSEAGLLQRFHGGAGPAGAAEALRLDYRRKTEISVDDKTRIGAEAAGLIPDGAAVFLDVGSTVECAAKALGARNGLRVFTNSMRAALHFDPRQHDVTVLGGRLAGRDGSLVGEDVVLALADLRVDVALLGCSAVDEGGRVMDYDLSKIAVKKCAMKSAARSFLLAGKVKFGRAALAAFARLDDFSEVLDGA